MNTIESKIIITGVLFIISFIAGVWLSRTGRPLKPGIFSIHKIAALLAIVYFILIIYQLQKPVELGMIELISIIAAGLFVIITFVSGVLLSFDKPVNYSILAVHKIAPVLSAISIIVTIYILVNGK